MLTYADAANTLKGRVTRTIAHNTWLIRIRTRTIAVRHHNTEIVEIQDRGLWRVFAGGYRTVTTKRRINEYAPCCVYQKRHVWYTLGGEEFQDGSYYNAAGHLVKCPAGHFIPPRLAECLRHAADPQDRLILADMAEEEYNLPVVGAALRDVTHPVYLVWDTERPTLWTRDEAFVEWSESPAGPTGRQWYVRGEFVGGMDVVEGVWSPERCVVLLTGDEARKIGLHMEDLE